MFKIEQNCFFDAAISFINKKLQFDHLRPYKNISGIYSIYNIVTDEHYIGQSINLYKRINEHIRKLRLGNHKYSNHGKTLLQKAWDKYGERSFVFSVIETCEKDFLDDREVYWIEFYHCNYAKYNKGYNYNKGGSATYKKEKRKTNKNKLVVHKGEEQKVISKHELSQYKEMGYITGFSETNKEKMFKNINKYREYPVGENHPLYGKKLTKEHRNKLSKSHKGHKLTNEQINKRTETNIKNGKILSVCQFDTNGNFLEEYENAEDVKRKTGFDSTYIRDCCKGKYKMAHGYIWKFKKDCNMDAINHEYPKDDDMED